MWSACSSFKRIVTFLVKWRAGGPTSKFYGSTHLLPQNTTFAWHFGSVGLPAAKTAECCAVCPTSKSAEWSCSCCERRFAINKYVYLYHPYIYIYNILYIYIIHIIIYYPCCLFFLYHSYFLYYPYCLWFSVYIYFVFIYTHTHILYIVLHIYIDRYVDIFKRTCMHYNTLHYTMNHTTLHCTAGHCIASLCTALHCMSLHYVTLHYITFIDAYILYNDAKRCKDAKHVIHIFFPTVIEPHCQCSILCSTDSGPEIVEIMLTLAGHVALYQLLLLI